MKLKIWNDRKWNNIKWNYLALAFVFPVAGMLVLMICGGYAPFGKYSMLYSDMYHQYYPFFVAYRKALLSGQGLLYSWNVGLGMDYLGLISYYLASPLNLLSVLIPESWTLGYFSLLMPVKLGLASLFFAIFLKKTFQKDDLSISLFGCFYGMCAWALGYQWNVMWLDTFALLPLVVLGAVSLLRDKKFFLYTFTLFLAIFSNYYIGFFVCIFIFFLFFVYEICRFRGFKRFFLDLCRIALFSALAIGMTAILELPAFAALQTTQSSVNNFPQGFKLNIADENTWRGLLDAMRQVAGNMGGGLEPTFKEGLPNLYCGVGSLLLAFLFLTAKKVKLRDKLCSVGLLVFFILSTIIRQLDYVWHGFHFTNMIPYRFTFLYSFVVLYMAYRAYLMRRGFRLWQILVSGGLSLLVFACSDQRFDPAFLSYNLVFLILYLTVLIYGITRKSLPAEPTPEQISQYRLERKRANRFATLCFAGIMAAELVMNQVNFSVRFPCTAVSNYPKGTPYTESIVRYMREREENNLFYRAEFTHSQTLNDAALVGFNGISTFTSSANVRVTEFMKSLGYGAKNTYNRYCFEESSPVANLFLGLKYMIERDTVKENPYFHELHRYGTVSLLENNAYLPLGFLANTQLSGVDFSADGNHFQFQNRLLSAASGISESVWHTTGTDLEIEGKGVTVSTQSKTGYCAYENEAQSSGTLVYTYTSKLSGLLCIDLELPKRNSYTVFVNGVQLFNESYSLPQMLSVCSVEPGDQVEIHLTCKAGEKSSMNVQAAILDNDLFLQAYDVLRASTLELTEFSATRVAGTIDCDRDGLLYTSVPQNGNWSAIVDGREAEIVLVGDAMVSLPLTEGSHTVELVYRNGAFSMGWKISLACALLFLGLTAWKYTAPPKKGKYEK